MKTDHTHIVKAFQNFGDIISILANDTLSVSLEEISKILSMPVVQVREIIIQLFQFDELSGALTVQDDSFFLDPDSDPSFPSNMRSGFYDQCHFQLLLRADAFISHDQFLFQCDNSEYRMLTSEYQELKKATSAQPFYTVKESPFTPPIANNQMTKLLEIINQAIEFEHPLSIQYQAPAKQKQKTTFYPVFIYYNIANSCIYCIDGSRSDDGKRNAYRLDRIQKAEIVSPKKFPMLPYTPLTEQEQQDLYCFWGAPNFYQKTPDEKFHVKLKIFNETSNILSKIQAETAHRKYGSLYQSGNEYFYEDDIIGKDIFRSWLRSYGSSVLVLEPLALAKEIYEMERLKLEVFEKGMFLL